MTNPKPFVARISAARWAVVLPVFLASAMTVVAWTCDATASFRFDVLGELLDKSNKIGVECAANFERLDEVEPPLSEFVFTHVALGHAQQLGQCFLGYPFLAPKLFEHHLK